MKIYLLGSGEEIPKYIESFLVFNQKIPFPLYHFLNLLNIQLHILDILAPLNTSIRKYALRNRTGSARHDGLFLLHNAAQSVITPCYRVLLDISTFSKFFYWVLCCTTQRSFVGVLLD